MSDKFICEYCKKEFDTKIGKSQHKNSFCKMNPYSGKKQPEYRFCDKCNCFISGYCFSRHYNVCDGTGPDIAKPAKNHLTPDGLVCIYCDKECKNRNSLAQHETRCKFNPTSISVGHQKNKIFSCQYCFRIFTTVHGKSLHETFCQLNPDHKDVWNKGQTKVTNSSIAKGVETFKKNENLGIHKSSKYKHTEETKNRLRVIMADIYSKKQQVTKKSKNTQRMV